MFDALAKLLEAVAALPTTNLNALVALMGLSLAAYCLWIMSGLLKRGNRR